MRRHSVFLIVLGLAALLRFVTMIAYFPAFWYSDSFGYLPPALHPYPFVVRPVGYSLLLLWPLRVFHSVAVVAVVQHVFGLLAGTLIYVLLRRRFRFAGWTATLAAVPVLLSAYEIQLEHFVMSDALFMILTVTALVIALWRQVPSILACIAVGLLLAAAAITRTEGLPIAATFALAVLVSYASFPERLARVLALAVSFAFPVLVYASWFQDVHGHFELESTYGGAFLAARVEPFADCSVIHPPANERWLCLRTPVARRLPPDTYLWGPAAVTPLAKPPTGPPFSARTSEIAEKFALHAIEHEPRAYSASLWRMFLQTFKWNSGPYTNGQQTWMFPAHQPETVAQLARASPGTTDQSFYQYNGGRNPDTEFRQPWAGILRVYQDVAVVVPPALGGIVIVGLIGVCLAFRRRGGPAFLPWTTGMLMLVLPAAVSSYEARYVVPTVPFFCVAAALAIREIGNRNQRLDRSPDERARRRADRSRR
ncbi:MAG TPA: hypothetical protein VMA72_14125 [Streptosporangiaceae bacterium]|nr:hypothetical protein [Streptosporangiaceae bacterium]